MVNNNSVNPVTNVCIVKYTTDLANIITLSVVITCNWQYISCMHHLSALYTARCVVYILYYLAKFQNSLLYVKTQTP